MALEQPPLWPQGEGVRLCSPHGQRRTGWEGVRGSSGLKGGQHQAVQSVVKHLLRISPCDLCPSPFVLYPVSCALHPVTCTLFPIPFTLCPALSGAGPLPVGCRRLPPARRPPRTSGEDQHVPRQRVSQEGAIPQGQAVPAGGQRRGLCLLRTPCEDGRGESVRGTLTLQRPRIPATLPTSCPVPLYGSCVHRSVGTSCSTWPHPSCPGP